MFLLLLVRAVSQGEPAYQQFLEWAGHPLVVLLNVVSFFFVVFHAVTWFNLAPQAMVVRVGGTRVPGCVDCRVQLRWRGRCCRRFVAWILLGA